MCKDSAMTDRFGAEHVSVDDRHEVAVLALPHVVAFELGLPHRFLGGAVDGDGRPLYRVRTCTVDGGPVRTSAHYAVLPDHDAAILRTAATIVIPGIVGGPPVVEGRLDPTVAAALAGRRPDARLVSICTGAYVLAAAGVLDGRPATTHWMRTEPFRTFFPEVRLDPDVLYVDDGDVLTSAGNAAGIDLLLHVVRRDHGAEVANRVARRNVVAPWRDGGQSQFSQGTDEAAGPVRADRAPVPAPGIGAARTFALANLGRAAPPAPPRRPGGDERAHLHPPVPRRDRAEPAHLARRAAGRAGPPAAGDHGPARRAHRRRRRVRHRRLPAPAPARGDRRSAGRLPADVPGATRSDRCTGWETGGRDRCDHRRADDPRRPQARRRALRLRALQGAPGAAGRPGRSGCGVHGHQPPAEAGEVAGRAGTRGARRAVLAARRATRWCSATEGPRRSGTPPRSGWCASARCTSPTASSRRSSPSRRRAPRSSPTR